MELNTTRRTKSTPRTWFITGAGRGIGRLLAEAALVRGDRVVGTARRPEVFQDLALRYPTQLVVSQLDVTDRDGVFASVAEAVAAFGGLDVVVNNAGYGLSGAVEEVTEAQARGIIDTNFFGALWVCQAVAPLLRAQRSGHVVQMSSVLGLSSLPTMGLYSAGKFALEGMSEAFARELQSFGVHVTIVEPRAYATDFMGASMQMATFDDVYLPVRMELMEQYRDAMPGDPARVAEALLALVDDPAPPRRLMLGDDEFDNVVALYQARIAELVDGELVSRAAG